MSAAPLGRNCKNRQVPSIVLFQDSPHTLGRNCKNRQVPSQSQKYLQLQQDDQVLQMQSSPSCKFLNALMRQSTA